MMTDSEPKRQPHPSSEKVLAAVGAVADAWAHLEFDINEAIWELANVEQQAGACITAQIISIGGRTRALAALVAWRAGDKELLGKVNRFGAEAESVGRQRNRVIHDPWYVRNDTDEPHQLRITADRRLDFDFAPNSIEDIHAVRDKIFSVADDFRKLKTALFAALPPFSRQTFSKSIGIWDAKAKG